MTHPIRFCTPRAREFARDVLGQLAPLPELGLDDYEIAARAAAVELPAAAGFLLVLGAAFA